MELGQLRTAGIHRKTISESPAIAWEHPFRLAAFMVESGGIMLYEPHKIAIYRETTCETKFTTDIEIKTESNLNTVPRNGI
jgi:hypothetical protein